MHPRPVYCCRRALTPPNVDGRVSGTVWEAVPRLGPELHIIGTASDRSRHFLETAVLHDDEALYVSFVSDPAPVPVTKRTRDDDLFNECAVELFLRAGKGYYEIEVNPLGAVLDLHFPDVAEEDWRKCAKWDLPGLRWAVAETGIGGRWCAQMAVPWAGVPEASRAEHEGNVCLFANFARSQRLPDGAFDLTTWSPAQRAFCELERMGSLVLSSECVNP